LGTPLVISKFCGRMCVPVIASLLRPDRSEKVVAIVVSESLEDTLLLHSGKTVLSLIAQERVNSHHSERKVLIRPWSCEPRGRHNAFIEPSGERLFTAPASGKKMRTHCCMLFVLGVRMNRLMR